MKKLTGILFVFCLFLTVHPVFAQDFPSINGRAHLQNIGWVNVGSDENHHMIIGTVGERRRIEAFELNVNYPDLGIRYMSHVQDIGWQGDRENGATSGTTGQSKKIEGVTLRLIGANAPNFKLYYRTHVENYGWLDWTTEYAASGTSNLNLRCEAIEMVIWPKDAPAPGPTNTPSIFANNKREATHLSIVNTYRKQHGLSYVSSDPALLNVANHRVQELGTKFSHTRPNGRPYETIVKDVYPNYPHAGGAIIENISLARTPLMTRPEYAFDYLSTYVHQLDIVLNPDAKFMAWTAISTPRMGYSIELYSGLDRIDFADY